MKINSGLIQLIAFVLVPCVGSAVEDGLQEDLSRDSLISIPQNLKKEYPMFETFFQLAEKSEVFNGLLDDIKDRYSSLKFEVSADIFSTAQITSAKTTSKEGKTSLSGTISIREDVLNLPKFHEDLLWELCNAGNRYLDFPGSFSRSPDEYAFFIEAAEHMSCTRRTRIVIEYFTQNKEDESLWNVLECKDSSFVDLCISQFQKKRSNAFREYWKGANKPSKTYKTDSGSLVSHADLYRNDFENDRKERSEKSFSAPEKYLIEYAFSEWKQEEEIPGVSENTRKFYETILENSQLELHSG